MKRALLTLCALCVTTALWAETASNLCYEVIGGAVTITGCVESASGTLEIPSTLGGYPVTSIAPGAFFECVQLTSVTIPDSVTAIGESAFWGCTNLTSIVIPDGVKIIDKNVFENCYNLVSVTIPEGVTAIEYSAFDECFALSSIKIPSSVTSIGEDAFWYCTSLTSVTFHSGLKTIGVCAFDHCESLTSVKIPETVTALGEGAFASCPKLASITISSGDVSLDYGAFYGCATSATFTFLGTPPTIVAEEAFPERLGYYSSKYASAWNAVISNGKWNNLTMEMVEGDDDDDDATDVAFFGYTIANGKATITGLNTGYPATIVIPSILGGYPVTSIGSWAFQGEDLTSVTIPEGVTSIGDSAFEYCRALTSVTIPDGVIKIGNYAFGSCSALISVTIPEGVTSIGDYAFSDCEGLYKDENGVQYESKNKIVLIDVPESITGEFVIPESVRFIHSYAFEYCSGLTSITIPEGVTSIGHSAFYDCSSLTSVIFKGPPCFLDSREEQGCTDVIVTYTGRYAKFWKEQLAVGCLHGFDWVFITNDVAVTMTIVGAGNVTTPAADGIVDYFPKGESRKLVATPNEGYVFMGWSGDIVSTDTEIELSGNVEQYDLKVQFLPEKLLSEFVASHGGSGGSGGGYTEADVKAAVTEVIAGMLDSGALVSAEKAKESAKTEAGKVMDEKMEEKGVVTQDQIDQLALDTPVLGVQNGAATLSLKVKKATTLSGDESDWEELTFTEGDVTLDANGQPTVTITPDEDEDTAFYKFVVPTDQSK